MFKMVKTTGICARLQRLIWSLITLWPPFFQLDYQRLTNTERQILLAVAEAKTLSQEAVSGVVKPNERRRLPSILNSLQELGHLGQFGEHWGVGNEFLLRWTRENLPQLKADLDRAGDAGSLCSLAETIPSRP